MEKSGIIVFKDLSTADDDLCLRVLNTTHDPPSSVRNDDLLKKYNPSEHLSPFGVHKIEIKHYEY